MRITIFGATGGTGSELVRQALAAGHEVTAVVRDPARLDVRGERLRIERANVFDENAILPAVKGSEAVISALGSRGERPTTVCETATRAIIEALKACGTQRLLVISASGVATEHGDRAHMRLAQPILQRFLKEAYADMLQMERLVRASDVDWTIVRPPMLTNRPYTGRYRIAVGRHAQGVWVSRANLADAMLSLVGNEASFRAIAGVSA